MTDKQKLITELKNRMVSVVPLDDEPQFHTTPETLARYLKARDWNIDAAEKALRETVHYRRETHPLSIDCHWCHERPGFHSMRQVGFDESGRPVIYSSFAQAATHRNHVDDSVTHVTYLIENAKLTMGPGINTWVFVIDCTGMTLPVCNPKLGYGVTQILSNHYPERLGLVICINHSALFQGVWKAIKVFLHAYTVSKVKMIRSKSKILQTFQQYFSPELTNWLLEEVTLNKQRPLPRSQKEFWTGSGSMTDHDPRGCPSYVTGYMTSSINDSDNSPDHRLHRPHPNVCDAMHGSVTSPEVLTAMRDHIREHEPDVADKISHDNEDDDSDDLSSAAGVEIDEEYQIPDDAVHLNS